MDAIVKHIRHDSGEIVATIAAIDAHNIGAAFHNPKDKLSKHIGRSIAIGRAEMGSVAKCPQNRYVLRAGYEVPLITIVNEEVLKLRERATIKFRQPAGAEPIFMK